MFQQITRIAAATFCAVSLVTLASAPAHAQSQPKPIFTARADRVWVEAVIDSDQGSRLNRDLAQSYANQVGGSDWQVLENGQFQMVKNGKPLMSAITIPSEDKKWFLIHARTPKLVANGEMWQYRDQPQEGWATLWLTMPSSDGKSFANIYLRAALKFPEQTGSSTDPGSGEFGGFGN